jgi:hypothetical protein
MGAAAIIAALANLLWPIAVVVIAVGYKPELMSFLPEALRRKWKVKALGVEVEVDAAAEQQKTADIVRVENGKIELKEIPGLVRTNAIANLERDLHARLVNVVGADKVDVLVRNLAQARLEAAFGFIYAGIFGSQIAGLIQLQARRKVSIDEAHKFCLEAAAQKYPEVYAEYGFPG